MKMDRIHNHPAAICVVQEAKQCFEEAMERATAEAEEDERYYKLIAITIRSGALCSPSFLSYCRRKNECFWFDFVFSL